MAEDDLVGVALRPLDRRDVDRRGQEIDDRVEQRLHALVAVGCPAQHRRHAPGDGGPADARHHLVVRELLALQKLLHQTVVGLGDGLLKRRAVFLGLAAQLGGNLGLVDRVSHVVHVDFGLHLEKVDQAPEVGLGADRNLYRHGVRVKPVAQHTDHAMEVRADDVHLVDVREPRHVVLRRLAPHGLRLRLHSALGTKDRHRPVQHAKRSLDLHGEVHVAGRVYDVDLVSAPLAGRRGRRDRDAALLLLLHPVHGRHAFVDLADAVRPARIVQDALGRRGLSGVYVRHDADVSDMVKGVCSSHGRFLSFFVLVRRAQMPALKARFSARIRAAR
ncbi:MAG: hypothetical protein BWY81_01284 [Firmicutes bacterium ADurb.Bin467]|nr:MAG: hypothetical protein BWY81_01284 [Firmicutes bacterium ADurb.Bin467]